MKGLLLPLAVLALLAVVSYLLTKQGKTRGAGGGPWPYYAKTLLSPAEQALYHRLVAVLPDHMVLAQVQLSRVLGVKKGFSPQEWNNRVSQKSLDFLICRKDSSPVVAIELDDRTHMREDRRKADATKDKALAAAAVPLIRWQATALPDDSTIRQAVLGQTAVGPASGT